MTREEKHNLVAELKTRFEENPFFYLADSGAMTVAEVTNFRRECFKNGITMVVAKNSLIKKALEQVDADAYSGIYDALKGFSAILFSEQAATPGKMLKDFRKKSERPLLKGAYIEGSVYLGDNQLDALAQLKSKEELIGEVINLLQSPAKNVLGALQSGGQNLAGILKTLSDKDAA